MPSISYISTIERYHEYRDVLRELMGSILTGVGQGRVFTESEALNEAICGIGAHYPFVELLFTLDADGIQSSPNVACAKKQHRISAAAVGEDRGQRPYFLMARESESVIVTEPYLSTATGNLCLSAALKWRNTEGQLLGYIVVDIDLAETIEFLMGDITRRRFVPTFQFVYSLIALGLFAVVGILLYSAFSEVATLFSPGENGATVHLKPFGVIIFLTLGLAVFDLGKTILEEEVLMHKDIFRHSSTRRTITRFMAAILIAVSIEALLMMFKAALGEGGGLLPAVWMMFAAIGLLIGLGIYVYLGARAEEILRRQLGTHKH